MLTEKSKKKLKMTDVAKSFKMQGYNIKDDPMEILKILKFF